MKKAPILDKSRIFDYLEKRGLEKITDVNAGEWHIYILKELIDNALDADEASGTAPAVGVAFAYKRSGHMSIVVSNGTEFPIDDIDKIFSLEAYASVKDYFNNITRGQQGNGLKTIAGIPYALHNFSYGTYALRHRPVTIQVGDQVRDLQYDLDEARQTAKLRVESRQDQQRPIVGTHFTVRVTAYRPTPPPSVREIEALALKYAAFNNFAAFSWNIDIEGEQQASWEFTAQSENRVIYPVPPASWYRFDQFCKLLHRLRKHQVERLENLLRYFLYLDQPDRRSRIAVALDRQGIGIEEALDYDEPKLKDLYHIFLDHTPQISFEGLGELGREAVTTFVERYLAPEGRLCYRRHKTGPEDGSVAANAPYVLEVFLVRSGVVSERTLWAGVNFTPLYKDPFYRKLFTIETDHRLRDVRGLDRVLQAQGIDAEDNVLVGIHLVCPNVEFQSYGKAEFDCRLVEEPLLSMIEEAAEEFKRRNRIKPQEQLFLDEIDDAARIVSSNGRYRFTAAQLFHKVCESARSKNPDLSADYGSYQLRRFQSILVPQFEEQNGPIKGLIRTHKAKFLEPAKGYNGILWILKENFEDVFISNNLADILNLALFWGEVDSGAAWSSLMDRLEKNKSYVIFGLHDADLAGCLAAARVAKLVNEEAAGCQYVDLGLTPLQAEEMSLPSERLDRVKADDVRRLEEIAQGVLSQDDLRLLGVEKRRYDLNCFSVPELLDWFQARYLEIGIVRNRRLKKSEVLTHLQSHFFGLTREMIRKRVAEMLALDRTVDRIADELTGMRLVTEETLWQKMSDLPPKRWKAVLESLADDLVASHLSATEIRRSFGLEGREPLG